MGKKCDHIFKRNKLSDQATAIISEGFSKLKELKNFKLILFKYYSTVL